MNHLSHGVHVPRPAPPPRRVSGVRAAPAHGFARFAPSHGRYDLGRQGFGFRSQGYIEPCFPLHGIRSPPVRREMVDFANPTFEQMARHWYSTCFTNPSVETFAPAFSPFH